MMGFEPKFPLITGVFKIWNKILNFLKHKKACKIYTLQAFYFFSDRGGVRTPNPQSRNLIFYPVELRDQDILNFQFFETPNSTFKIGIWNFYIGI